MPSGPSRIEISPPASRGRGGYAVSPSLLFKSTQLIPERGQTAIRADEDVGGSSRVRELERLLGPKMLEVEVLKEALLAALGKRPS